MAIESLNPNDEGLIRKMDLDSEFALEKKISRSEQAFEMWRRLEMIERQEALFQLAQIMTQRLDSLATVLTKEIGKPIQQSRAEIKKCIQLCYYYVKQSDEFLAIREISTESGSNQIIFQPMGPILGVMPWNFPFWQSLRFAVPALASGNTVLLKLAENATDCALALSECFSEAGFEAGVYQPLFINYEQTERLIKNKKVKGLSFTGSTSAGQHLGSLAGQSLKKTVLELGGSDPYIVLKDANIEKAAEICVNARLVNNGQSCIAAKRFIIERPVYEEFVHHFVENCSKKVIGSPFLEATEVGPLAKESVRKSLDHQVRRSIEMGARLRFQSDINFSEGFFYPITVLTEVPFGAPVFKEETFGPVAALVAVDSPRDAIECANSSQFGLGAAIFSENEDEAVRLAREIQAGMCAINKAVESHWELPFGGVKSSGLGRELGEAGARSFVNEKVIMKNPSAGDTR